MLSADVFEATIAPRRRQPLDVGEERELEVDALGRRLDDEVGIGERLGQVGRRAQPAERRLGVGGRDLAALDASSDDLLDRRASLLERARPRRRTSRVS